MECILPVLDFDNSLAPDFAGIDRFHVTSSLSKIRN